MSYSKNHFATIERKNKNSLRIEADQISIGLQAIELEIISAKNLAESITDSAVGEIAAIDKRLRELRREECKIRDEIISIETARGRIVEQANTTILDIDSQQLQLKKKSSYLKNYEHRLMQDMSEFEKEDSSGSAVLVTATVVKPKPTNTSGYLGLSKSIGTLFR